MRAFKSILGFVLALAVVSANATLSTQDESGSPGGQVTVSLNGSNATINLGATIYYGFDAAVLQLDGVRLGSIWGSLATMSIFPDIVSGPSAFISDLPIAGGTGTLLELDFTIIDPPTGTIFPFQTDVTFNCLASNPLCRDYPFDQVTSIVTIDRATGIPLPGTLPLLAVAVAALYWTRRRIA